MKTLNATEKIKENFGNLKKSAMEYHTSDALIMKQYELFVSVIM